MEGVDIDAAGNWVGEGAPEPRGARGRAIHVLEAGYGEVETVEWDSSRGQVLAASEVEA